MGDVASPLLASADDLSAVHHELGATGKSRVDDQVRGLLDERSVGISWLFMDGRLLDAGVDGTKRRGGEGIAFFCRCERPIRRAAEHPLPGSRPGDRDAAVGGAVVAGYC